MRSLFETKSEKLVPSIARESGQKPYFCLRNSNASWPPSSKSLIISLMAGVSIEPHNPSGIVACSIPPSTTGVSPTICSASPRTGIFALCVEKIN
jgi:hypothetical protein